jgi:outer membrane protein assembly factor BamB
MAHPVGRGPGLRSRRARLAAGAATAAALVIVLLSATGTLAGRQAAQVPPTGSLGGSSPSPTATGLTYVATASPTSSMPSSATQPPTPIINGAFAGDLLIADRGNDRILIVNSQKKILWRFPGAGSLPPGQGFSADDAFLSPDGRTILASEEMHQVLVRIDIASRRIIWQYGHYGRTGSAAGFLNTPDDAYPLANGNVTVADIRNCRVIEIAPDKHIVRTWGQTGVCRDAPPFSYNEPNGDTPLPDGGILITEIRGSRVVRLDASGRVKYDIHVPVLYPSDAQLDPHGNVVVADYSNPGAVVSVSPTGRLLWRYGPASGAGRLDHPSLADPLADGTIILNDDLRDRVILLNPKTGRILWQYGATGIAGRGANRLHIPDGIDLIPPGVIPAL